MLLGIDLVSTEHPSFKPWSTELRIHAACRLEKIYRKYSNVKMGSVVAALPITTFLEDVICDPQARIHNAIYDNLDEVGNGGQVPRNRRQDLVCLSCLCSCGIHSCDLCFVILDDNLATRCMLPRQREWL